MDWIQELTMALTVWGYVRNLRSQGKTGEVDLDVTATVVATGEKIDLNAGNPIRVQV